MDFDRLRAFVWTLEEGNISAAARRLCRTQPAVTRMLQTLEDQVGAQLIDRRARPMRPTIAGAKVLEYARDILAAADRLTDGSVRPGGARQTLRLGVSRSLLWHLRDPRFVHPTAPLSATDFHIRSGWSPRLYRRFTRGEFDGAVLLMPHGWAPDIPVRGGRVRQEELIVIAPRTESEPPRRSVRKEDLQQHSWILNPDGCGFRGALATAMAAAGHRLHVQFEVDAAPQEHLSMVAAGIGCSIVPKSALQQNVRMRDDVQQWSIDGFDGDLEVWVIWDERCQSAPGTEDALAAIFGTPGPASTAARWPQPVRTRNG
jgi:DNA-binding transcriptional LysR family regulator